MASKRKRKTTRKGNTVKKIAGAVGRAAVALFSVHYRRDRECGATTMRAESAAAAAAHVRGEHPEYAEVTAHGPLPE